MFRFSIIVRGFHRRLGEVNSALCAQALCAGPRAAYLHLHVGGRGAAHTLPALQYESGANSFIHSFIHSIIHSLMHSFIHSFIHSFGSLLINSMCTQTWACRHMSTACAFTRGGSSQRDGAFERGMPSRTFLGFMCHASAHMNSPCAMSHGGFSVMSSLSAMSHDGCAKPVPV